MADKNPEHIDEVTSQIEEVTISEKISRDSESRSDNPPEDTNSASEYDMQGDKCGRCIIINQNFENSETGLESRHGTKFDVARLEIMFRWLKFEVTVYDDRTKDELDTIFEKEALNLNDSSKCLIVCILSHGKEGGFYTADGDFYKMQNVLDLFDGENCKSLIFKPKLFFVQACQGNKHGKYVQFDNPSATEDEDESYKSPKKKKYLAVNADQFVFYSSTPGNKSWRSPKEGSWFIQTVCSVFEESADKNFFYDLVLEINRKIATRAEMLKNQRVASMMSTVGQNTLLKKIRFHPDKPFKDFIADSKIMQAIS